MWKKFLVLILFLAGCNSIYYKPQSLDKSEVIYVDCGGFQMQHYIKKHLEERGYNITVGHKKGSFGKVYDISEDAEIATFGAQISENSRYVIQVGERKPLFHPIWCLFNGFWWLRFNISIVDNKTGKEILGWAGRGCVDSSLRKLDKILDKMEMK